MGGQACVFYGAAQVSRDIDLVLLASPENFNRLESALLQLEAERIAVPPFSPEILHQGHAVHFRCAAANVQDLRIDVMTRLRGVLPFELLWERRTVIQDSSGTVFSLLSVPDLVQAKKTQRSKDWPIIELLVAIHYRENSKDPRQDWIEFWLREARTPELISELVRRFPDETNALRTVRPLLAIAPSAHMEELRKALDEEVRNEQAVDRLYWAPLKAELEKFRHAEVRQSADSENRQKLR